ncbi:tRNA adenylyltransferase [Anopheles sinensis]|uniref:tRNA adenylyltransferase n=1 Tax=Anopheles sinensis TaxID=74873 RepID=A0A084VRP9_ANOSI|nr:tRNA adenylyltransferase [Anopheles sinensis]
MHDGSFPQTRSKLPDLRPKLASASLASKLMSFKPPRLNALIRPPISGEGHGGQGWNSSVNIRRNQADCKSNLARRMIAVRNACTNAAPGWKERTTFAFNSRPETLSDDSVARQGVYNQRFPT